MEESTELTKTLAERLKDGSYECAICSECIRLRDKMWSCLVCYGIVHLLCIRRWVKSQIENRETRSYSELSRSSPRPSLNDFCCPLCRSKHTVAHLEDNHCFCAKAKDPQPDPLLVPGSCGQTCEKRRSDRKCPHVCTLMCHPGPCPPCALSRLQSCYCGKAEKPVGCSSGIEGFECDGVCDKLLDCGNHRCIVPCHEGPCAICTVFVEETCFCGSTQRKRRDGDTSEFSCGKVCSKLLDCGNHYCSFTCHRGPCEPCQRVPDKQKYCFCGKVYISQLMQTARTSCLDPVPSCGLLCEAPLPCGHSCAAVCHESAVCPPCSVILSEKCKCGAQVIHFPCFCSYLPHDKWEESLVKTGITGEKLLSEYPPRCNKACRKYLSCGKHTCREVCCTNDDHTCYQICTKRLSCGVHPCGQLCHKGPCPSCSSASYERLFCRCRRTWVEPPVPCGTKPPICEHVCVVPRPCGHPANHSCHIEERCPDCVVPVEKRCGSHEKVMPYFLPCYRQNVSCGKKCGKMLSCCGKACDKTCHAGVCEHKCVNAFPALR